MLSYLTTLLAIVGSVTEQPSLPPATESSPSAEAAALTYAQQQLPKQGVLQKTDDGLLYLKVSDSYIYGLLPLLPNVLSPPPYFGPGLIGACIPIINPGEINWIQPPPLPPLGTRYSFNLGSFFWETPQNIPHAVKTCSLGIQSIELSKIRTDAHLPPKTFSIMIGVQYLESTTPPLEISEAKDKPVPPTKNRVTWVDNPHLSH